MKFSPPMLAQALLEFLGQHAQEFDEFVVQRFKMDEAGGVTVRPAGLEPVVARFQVAHPARIAACRRGKGWTRSRSARAGRDFDNRGRILSRDVPLRRVAVPVRRAGALGSDFAVCVVFRGDDGCASILRSFHQTPRKARR